MCPLCSVIKGYFVRKELKFTPLLYFIVVLNHYVNYDYELLF